MRPAPALCLLLALALPATALAQGHAHEEGEGIAAVLHDGPPDGRAVVGAYTHFGFALLKDGVPQVHRDARFEVVHNGQLLFATTDSHEYDGIFGLDVVFPSEGVYEVRAESEGMLVGSFGGVVVAPVNETLATVTLAAAPQLPQGRAHDLVVEVLDADGALLPHTDVIVDVREQATGTLVSRMHAHVHDEPIRFSQSFPRPGDYEVSVVGYKAFQTGRSVDVRPVLGVFPLSVGPVPAGAALPGPMEAAASRPLSPAGASASADGFALHGGYDPQPLVGVGNLARLSALLVDANGTPVQHVDFRFRLEGPDGLVFASETLHEYDGAFEHAFAPHLPGLYRASLVAVYGDVELPIGYVLEALPPVAPLDPGSFDVAVVGLDGIVAGAPTELTFSVSGPTGPLAHSEVDVTIARDGEPPIYQFKLHTHDSGTTAATVVIPQEGAWRVRVDPVPLMPQASLVRSASFAFEAAAGVLPEPVLPLGGAEGEARPVPGPAALAVMMGMAAAVALSARRRR